MGLFVACCWVLSDLNSILKTKLKYKCMLLSSLMHLTCSMFEIMKLFGCQDSTEQLWLDIDDVMLSGTVMP